MTLYLPIGPPACGKSTLVEGLIRQGWLDEDAVVSTDALRIKLTGDVADQSANGSVFTIVNRMISERLQRGLDVWHDATNLRGEWRTTAIGFAQVHGQPIVCILFTANDATCRERNSKRVQPVPDDVMNTMLTYRREVRYDDLPGYVFTDEEFVYRTMISRPMERQT